MPLRRAACAVILAFGLATAAEAGELSGFQQAVAAATAPLREALVRLDEGNVGVAHLKLREALTAWRNRVLPFSDRPPDPLSGDPGFGDVLQEVAVRLQKAEALSANGEMASARDQASPILRALGDLRSRNGLSSFADCAQAAHEAVTALWLLREESLSATSWAEIDSLGYLSAVAHDRYRRCRTHASAQLAESEEFGRLHEAITADLARLRHAMAAGDTIRVQELLTELRDLDQLFWLRFG